MDIFSPLKVHVSKDLLHIEKIKKNTDLLIYKACVCGQ